MRLLFFTTAYPPQKTGGEATVTAIHAEALVLRGHDAHVAARLRPRGPATDDERNGVQLHFRPRGVNSRLVPPCAPEARARLDAETPAERPVRTRALRHLAAVDALAHRGRCVPELGPFDVIEVPDAGAVGMRLARRNRVPLVVVPHGPGITRYSEIIGFPRTLRWRISRRQVESPCGVWTSCSRRRRSGAKATSGQLGDSDVPVEWCYHATHAECWTDVRDATTTEPRRGRSRAALDGGEGAGSARRCRSRPTDIPGLEVVFVGEGAAGRLGVLPACAADRGHGGGGGRVVPVHVFSGSPRSRRVCSSRRGWWRSRSWWDTFSSVAAEALAAGRPVVCTHNVGLAPLISDAQAGAVVPPDDARALGVAMRPFLEDAALAAAAGRRGRALFDGPLSYGTVLSRREAAYERAIGNSRSAHGSCTGSC